MKNPFKKNEIEVIGKKLAIITTTGQIKTKANKDIFCGDCLKKFDLKPSNKNKKDEIKAVEKGAIFYINEDKTKIVCKSCGRELDVTRTYESVQKEIDEQNKKDLENLHIIKVAESWETGLSYFALSAKVEYDTWLKIKPYFHYHTSSMDIDDEFYGPAPRGWVCCNYREVEKILNIPFERTFDYLQEQYKKELECQSIEEMKLKCLIDECKSFFDDAEKPNGDNLVVEGEIIEDPNYPLNIYGGGHYWVIQKDFIWFIRNNGFDGADWSLNNVATGGAGAIGVRVQYDEDLACKLRCISS